MTDEETEQDEEVQLGAAMEALQRTVVRLLQEAVALGYLRHRTGSLLPGMLLHFTHNLLTVLSDRAPWA